MGEPVVAQVRAQDHESDILLAGYACRLPGAASVQEFWNVLQERRCTISEVGEGRWPRGRYFHPRPGEPNKTVIGESHSWVEWWCGGWVAYDPTLRRRLTDGYVRVGHGRDYGDVAPLRGTYAGGSSTMFVTVEMTELG